MPSGATSTRTTGSLVSADRHATLIGMNIVDDVAAGDVIHAVERADATAEFDVAVTGAGRAITTSTCCPNVTCERGAEIRPACGPPHPAAGVRDDRRWPSAAAEGAARS